MNIDPQKTRMPTIFISAAETSADLHAGALLKYLRQERGDLSFYGLGGPAMEKAGCSLMADLVRKSAMLTHAFWQVGYYLKLRRAVKQLFRRQPPELVVLLDSPAWNIHLAKIAHGMHIPVLYYIAPQYWAWGRWRIRKFRKWVDHLACILPFEQEWFTVRGVDAQYVGHPLFDHAEPVAAASETIRQDQPYPMITLLPGSRGHEITAMWPQMQQIAHSIRKRFPNAQFLTTAPNEATCEQLRRSADSSLDIQFRQTGIEAICRYADLALVASGTATLQVAAQSCPMIVMYDVPRWQWHFGRTFLLKTRFISLVNILAEKKIVPEFVPCGHQSQTISRCALELLNDQEQSQRIRDQLKTLMEPIIQPGAAANVGKMIQKMLPKY